MNASKSRRVTYRNTGACGSEWSDAQFAITSEKAGVCLTGVGRSVVLDLEQTIHLRDWLTLHFPEASEPRSANIVESD